MLQEAAAWARAVVVSEPPVIISNVKVVAKMIRIAFFMSTSSGIDVDSLSADLIRV